MVADKPDAVAKPKEIIRELNHYSCSVKVPYAKSSIKPPTPYVLNSAGSRPWDKGGSVS